VGKEERTYIWIPNPDPMAIEEYERSKVGQECCAEIYIVRALWSADFI
jgi:hypothetical protein